MINKIREAANEAAAGFTGWDWPHDPAGIVADGPGPQADWAAWEAARREELESHPDVSDAVEAAEAERVYGEAVQRSAEAAADLALQAITAAEEGDLASARRFAEEAALQEGQWGDAPLLRPAVPRGRPYRGRGAV